MSGLILKTAKPDFDDIFSSINLGTYNSKVDVFCHFFRVTLGWHGWKIKQWFFVLLLLLPLLLKASTSHFE